MAFTSNVLNESDAARYIGMSVSWLSKTRMKDRPGGPPYVKLTGKAVRYLRTDLDAWLLARRHQCDATPADAPVPPAGGAEPVARISEDGPRGAGGGRGR